jgi:hypothetical protein
VGPLGLLSLQIHIRFHCSSRANITADKKQVNEFQSRMQQQQQEHVQQQNNFSKKEPSTSKADDYIDFEEVKH